MRNHSPLEKAVAQRNSVGLENEEDIYGDVKGYFSVGKGFNPHNGNGTVT